METLRVEREASILTVNLARPNVRNAFNVTLIHELIHTFSAIPDDVRVVVLQGDGPVFCAGADLAMMQETGTYTLDQNITEARLMAKVFDTVDRCPVPVIARVHGAAMGGGLGLVACTDIAVAEHDAKFALSEVKLGLVPAVISPYVIAKIGAGQARRYFTTAEVFDGRVAKQMGLVHEAVDNESLDDQVMLFVDTIRANGPNAVRAAKKLIRDVAGQADPLVLTSQLIAELRVSPEGQEGLKAFLAKRKPSWKP
jgi:methylglutaconyl-CoA hydratase